MSAVLPHLEITPQRPDWLAGAPGFEPGNGGIKIQVVRIIYHAHSEKVRKLDLSLFKRLAGISERRDKRRAVIVSRPPLPSRGKGQGSNVFGRAARKAALRAATNVLSITADPVSVPMIAGLVYLITSRRNFSDVENRFRRPC